MDDTETRRLAAIRVLRRAKGFQHRDSRYERLLDDPSEAVRLEVLSFAVDDVVGLPEDKVKRIYKNGSDIERRYALLILSRNGLVDRLTIESASLGEDFGPEIWRAACYYAIDPKLTGILDLFRNISLPDLSLASLALNLTVTVANAIHRVLVYDLIKILLSSNAVNDRLLLSLRNALPALALRQSFDAIAGHTFKKGEVWRILA